MKILPLGVSTAAYALGTPLASNDETSFVTAPYFESNTNVRYRTRQRFRAVTPKTKRANRVT